MPAPAPPTGPTAAEKLAAIGARLRARRKALAVTATEAAEAAGMSRMTLHRVERGEPSVTMGAYMNAVAALGLELELVDARAPKPKAKLPRRVALAAYPELKRLSWQLGDASSLTPREALSVYERNWRHVDQARLSDAERALIRRLVEGLGGARLLV